VVNIRTSMTPDLFHLANAFTYFDQSNLAGKVIIFILIAMSLVAWTIMLGKWQSLRMEQRRNRVIDRYFHRELGSVVYLEDSKPFMNRGPFGLLLAEAIRAYHQTDFSGSGGPTLDQARIGLVENALQRAVARQSQAYEEKMIFLGSIVTGAPFLGLLGTVWGVMDAFGAVALQSTATLQNLAPGVSGALLTTVMALVVAIPSVFGYNVLLSMVRANITELENFASSVADRYEREHQLVS